MYSIDFISCCLACVWACVLNSKVWFKNRRARFRKLHGITAAEEKVHEETKHTGDTTAKRGTKNPEDDQLWSRADENLQSSPMDRSLTPKRVVINLAFELPIWHSPLLRSYTPIGNSSWIQHDPPFPVCGSSRAARGSSCCHNNELHYHVPQYISSVGYFN